jgi:hypothetical protein
MLEWLILIPIVDVKIFRAATESLTPSLASTNLPPMKRVSRSEPHVSGFEVHGCGSEVEVCCQGSKFPILKSKFRLPSLDIGV